MQLPFAIAIQDTGTELIGPLRVPRQMLAAQTYDDHNSIHDNATAQKYGFKGGTIEGPTHFSQFAPLCVALWGPQWLAQGSLSAHYRNACFEGDKVRALVTKPSNGATQTTIRMEREDGTEILRGEHLPRHAQRPDQLRARVLDRRCERQVHRAAPRPQSWILLKSGVRRSANARKASAASAVRKR